MSGEHAGQGMELRTLLFLLCLSTFVTGILPKEIQHGFKGTLHDNMKEYFKNYMVENFKGVIEKQFDKLKISKWIGEDVSKRSQQASALERDIGLIVVKDILKGLSDTLKADERSLGSILEKRDNTIIQSPDILAWFREVSDLRQTISSDINTSFKSWSDVLSALPDRCDESPNVPMSTHHSDITLLGKTPDFMNLFWPFRFDINVMNQRLAAYGLTNIIITESNETLKLDLFEELQDLQAIRLPVKGNQIMFSFGDEDVVEGLNRSRLVPLSKSYVKAAKHLYTKEEQEYIRLLATEALNLINKTHTELHSAMVQMISCIAFAKDEAATHISGSANSALGLIWLNPQEDWTVPVMAEQLVHEFIHITLFYAELVHRGYKDVSRLPDAKAMSSIRRKPRPYDKSLHAAYVSAGLITFHTRAGFINRAAELVQTLPEAVQELNRVNAETDVLDEAGRAMLDFLTDYVCLTRM
ncbi:uncharacterized protein LOC124281682 [Haliotis rubra]|uniref:uncharacterized protein LOC124281682 n=1 Tax=Haliotis rubra TaxID=36100 RepID=UPI001EE5ADBA|nr:uncharacterized protein LOC124281682 [Haliotis rubra]